MTHTEREWRDGQPEGTRPDEGADPPEQAIDRRGKGFSFARNVAELQSLRWISGVDRFRLSGCAGQEIQGAANCE